MIIAVDTGGTKTLVAAFHTDSTIIREEKFLTPKTEQEYIGELSEAIKAVSSEAVIEAIVVAMPGIVKDGIAVWCNRLLWSNFDIKTALSRYYPEAPILVENDANLGGLGEVRRLREIPVSALYVTVSTGIGTGFITEGRIDPGLRLSEGGRSLVEYKGNVQEWELFAAGSAIKRIYGKYARDIHSKRSWKDIADRISRGFLAIIPLTQPEVIIIGGSIGSYFDRYEMYLLENLKQNLPPHIPTPHFYEARDAEKAVIYGCYYYGSDFLTS